MDERELPRATVAKRSRNAFQSSSAPRPSTPDFYAHKRRKLVEEPEVQAEEAWDLPSDTKMAMAALKRDFSQLSADLVSSFPAIIMKSQLYYLMEDKTRVDREVSELKLAGEIMEMFVPGKQASDLYLSFASDMASFISKRVETLNSASLPFSNISVADTRSVLQFFRDSIVGSHPEAFIYRESLHNMFDSFLISETIAPIDLEAEITAVPNDTPASTHKPKKQSSILTPEKKKPRIKYSDMERILIHEGWMTRRDVSSFWIAVPNFGRFTRSLKKGRSHIKGLLTRAKFHEKMQAELLEMKKIPNCELSVPYILKDMIGSNQLSRDRKSVV